MYAESAAIPRSGFAGAVTGTPLACSRSITPFQLDASANAPWTSTTVGRLGLVVSDMLAPLGSSAQWPERGAELGREQLGLLPGGEVAAPVHLVEVGDVRVARVDPAAWRPPDLAGERREGERDGRRRQRWE